MKHLHLTLGYLKEQRGKLDTSIALLETLLGQSNGHGGTLKTAADALALHEFAKLPTTPRRAETRKRAPQVMKPLPEVAIPSGLDVRGLTLEQAIPAALKAYKKPADNKTLAALLLGAGFEWNRPMPFTTRVGTFLGRYPQLAGVKGSKEKGWTLRA